MRVLVMSAGSAPAVCVIKALRLAIPQAQIVGADMDIENAGCWLCNGAYPVPAPTDERFIDTVNAIIDHEHIDFVFPIIDEELMVFAEHSQAFDADVIGNHSRTVSWSQDKATANDLCEHAGILVPESIYVPPVVIRPLRGRGSVGMSVARTVDQMEHQLALAEGQMITQRFIDGTEYTIDIVATPYGGILACIPRERMRVKAGMSFHGRTVHDDDLVAFGKLVAETFEVTGPANVQCIRDKDGIWFVELNPKYGAGSILTFRAGVNIPHLHLKMRRGVEIDQRELEYQDLTMLRHWEEIYV